MYISDCKLIVLLCLYFCYVVMLSCMLEAIWQVICTVICFHSINKEFVKIVVIRYLPAA